VDRRYFLSVFLLMGVGHSNSPMPTVHLSMPPVFGTTFYAAIRAGSVAQTIQQVVVGCTGAATPRRSRPRR